MVATGPGETATTVRLDLTTREDYPCAGFRIPYTAQVVGNLVNLTLGCVYALPGICLTVIAPATADLTVALTDGTYNVNLVGVAQTACYELTVDGADVQLRAAATLKESLHRIVNNLPAAASPRFRVNQFGGCSST